MAGNLFEITQGIIHSLNHIISGAVLLGLGIFAVIYTKGYIKEQILAQGVFVSVGFILEVVIAGMIFWWGPILISWIPRFGWTIPFLRWGILSGIVLLYFSRRKHSENRGTLTSILHLAILMLGWWIDRWVGMIFFSLPLLLIFYYTVYHFSLVTIPAANPDDKAENHQRFLVFCSYVWGLQMPLWNVTSTGAKEAEKRIDGGPSLIRFPGMIRMDTHQMTGVLNGNTLRAAGPGVVFTQKDDLPLDVIDLRNQIGKCPLHAFSKEGIPFLATVTVIFSIDREVWTPVLVHKLNPANYFLKNGNVINSAEGQAFPFSNARVQAALHLRSKHPCPDAAPERWDDHVLAIAEKAARETLAERSINDLWRARGNVNGNAAGEISGNIRSLIESPLRENGVRLISVKVSNFIFPDHKKYELKDEEGEQQIAAWNVEREREISIAHADALARAKRIEEDARMNARSILLTAIMEGLKQVNLRHRPKNPEAVSQVYLNALKSMIDQHLDLSYKSETSGDSGNNRDRDDE